MRKPNKVQGPTSFRIPDERLMRLKYAVLERRTNQTAAVNEAIEIWLSRAVPANVKDSQSSMRVNALTQKTTVNSTDAQVAQGKPEDILSADPAYRLLMAILNGPDRELAEAVRLLLQRGAAMVGHNAEAGSDPPPRSPGPADPEREAIDRDLDEIAAESGDVLEGGSVDARRRKKGSR